MKKRIIVLSAAVVLILGAGTAYAGDTVLFTPMRSAPVAGSLECHVTNVGKKPLPYVTVAVKSTLISGSMSCPDLSSASNSDRGHTCSASAGGGSVLCQVTITGGSHKSVRAVLNVVDSSGATILSVPATK